MIEKEDLEQQIKVERESVIVGGGAVNSVNGKTGNVILDAEDVGALPDTTVIPTVNNATLTIQENGNNIETFTANSSINKTANITVPTAVTDLSDASDYAKKSEVSHDIGVESTARENADANLQGQIDAISASSDVTDIVGTYAELQAYDTTHLKDNDIIKVLQDEHQNDETTYYRWSTSTSSFSLIGEEGPYYTKSQTDILLNAKQDSLTAGTNISISSNTISATDTTYTAGNGLNLSGTEFSADTLVLATQNDLSSKQNTLTAGSNISISGDTISATDTTYSNFTGTDGTAAGTAGLVPAPATTDAGKFLKADGTWDTAGGGGGPTVVQTTGTSTTDVMSQAATTNMIYPSGDETSKGNIFIQGGGQGSAYYTCIGPAQVSGYVNTTNGSTAIGQHATATGSKSLAIAGGSQATTANGTGSVAIGGGKTTANYGNAIGFQAQSTLEGVALGHAAYAPNYAVTIGSNSSATNNAYGIAVGYLARAWGSESIAIGSQISTSGQTGTVVIGNGPANGTQYATRNNEFCVHASTTANQPMVHSNVDTPTLGTDAANKNYVDSFYPVGTVYSSTSSTAPTFAGGTWTSIGSQTIGSSTVYYYERTA